MVTSNNKHFFHFSIPLKPTALHSTFCVYGTNHKYPMNHNFNEDIRIVIGVTLACDDFRIHPYTWQLR